MDIPSATAAESVCHVCGCRYPVIHGIQDMMPCTPSPKKIIQSWMESGPIVRVYDSMLWRHSPAAMAMLQISARNEFRMISRALQYHNSLEAVLDIASGTGRYSRLLAEQWPAATVFGLDLSMPMLNHAGKINQKTGMSGIHLIHCDAMTLPFSEESFDGIVCSGALHLFPDLYHVLTQINRVMKVSGRFVFAAFCNPSGRVWDTLEKFSARYFGLTPLHLCTLKTHLHHAKFVDLQIHYQKGLWIIASAAKA